MSSDSKKRLAVIFVWIGAAIFGALIALIVGNVLGGVADSHSILDGAASPIYEYEADGVPSISAQCLDLEVKAQSDVFLQIDKIARGEAVSAVLRDHGRLLYSSDIAHAVTGDRGGVLSLSDFVPKLKEKDCYLSACFYVEFDSASTAEAMNAAMEYEAALIGEIFESGFDEIVLMGVPNTSEGAAQLSKLCQMIRERCPEAIIGAAVSSSDFSNGKAALLLAEFEKFADFAAIDTSGLLNSGTNAANFAEGVLYYFEKYPIRLLIEDLGARDREIQLAALAKLGIYNVQSIGSAKAAG